MKGKFVTFEGIDGAGKSSHIQPMADYLRRQGLNVVITREPGGTPLGEKLRAILLAEPMHLETEALLMFASRREHLAQVIEPALARGDWVLCDRFSDASYAYQHGGRGLDLGKFDMLERLVHPNIQPDLTLLFDTPVDVAQGRINTERALDRFETEKREFHERVRNAYLARAKASPGRFGVIDAAQRPEEVADDAQFFLEVLVKRARNLMP